jgi:hypothetical protein
MAGRSGATILNGDRVHPRDLKAQSKLDDYEIERRIERKMWEGERLKVAQNSQREDPRSK